MSNVSWTLKYFYRCSHLEGTKTIHMNVYRLSFLLVVLFKYSISQFISFFWRLELFKYTIKLHFVFSLLCLLSFTWWRVCEPNCLSSHIQFPFILFSIKNINTLAHKFVFLSLFHQLTSHLVHLLFPFNLNSGWAFCVYPPCDGSCPTVPVTLFRVDFNVAIVF